MKKILLGLFILGTLGMAQQNYEVYVKNGIKISQSEADRDSKEIDKIINDKIISRYNNEGKKVLMEKSKKLYDEYMDGLLSSKIKDFPKNQQQPLKVFLSKSSGIVAQNGLNEIDKMEISVKEISFLEKNKAKVNVLVKYKDIDYEIDDEIIEETFKKSGITDKEMENFEKISKAKLDKFFHKVLEQNTLPKVSLLSKPEKHLLDCLKPPHALLLQKQTKTIHAQKYDLAAKTP